MSETDHGFAVLCPIAVDNKTLVIDRFEKGAQADFFATRSSRALLLIQEVSHAEVDHCGLYCVVHYRI